MVAHFGSINKQENREALIDSRNKAFQNRTDEINLYWKRTTYFSTAIGFVVAGIATIFAKDNNSDTNTYMVVFGLSLLLFILSFLWLRLNKGSKYWQEHWENVVEKIEKSISDDSRSSIQDYISKNPHNFYIASLKERSLRASVSKVNNVLCCVFLTISSILFMYYGRKICLNYPIRLSNLSLTLLATIVIIFIISSVVFCIDKVGSCNYEKIMEHILGIGFIISSFVFIPLFILSLSLISFCLFIILFVISFVIYVVTLSNEI